MATGILGTKVICQLAGKTCSQISTDPKKPSYIFVKPDDFKKRSDNDIRVIIFHEIAHHKWSPPRFQDSKIPMPLVEVMEEARIEARMADYINTQFKNYMLARSIGDLRAYFTRKFVESMYANPTAVDKPEVFVALVCALTVALPLGDIAPSYTSIGKPEEFQKILQALELLIQHGLGIKSDTTGKNYYQVELIKKALLNITLKEFCENLYPVIDKIKRLLDWVDDKDTQKAQAVTETLNHQRSTPIHRDRGLDRYFINEEDRLIAETFARRLKMILTDRKMTRFTNRQKSGKLDTRTAFKILNNRLDLFKRRKAESKDVNYQFTLLLDKSGSMEYQNRMYHTARATYLLAHALDTMKVTNYLATHDENTRPITKDKLGDVYADGDNDFQKAFDYASKRPLAKNTQEVIIMLTDGQDYIDTHQIKEIKQTRGSEIIGIGVGGINVTEMQQKFGQAIAVQDPRQLPDTFLSLVKRIML